MLIDTDLIRKAHTELVNAFRNEEEGIADPALIKCTCGEDWLADEGIPYYSSLIPAHNDSCQWRKTVMARHEALMSQPCYVNVYIDDRAYGGPEEGGWWYNCGEIVSVTPCASRLVAHMLVDLFNSSEEYSNEGRRDIGSVLSEGCYRIAIEWLPGENYPKERPYYE